MKQAKQYFSKMLMLLPLTFLATPLFYSLLGYHPEVKFFKLLVYIWYALFIYFGMTLSIIFKKYAYLPYPIVVIIAFLCKNICEIPALAMKKNIVYQLDLNATDGVYEIILGTEMRPDDFAYLAGVVFVTTLIAGFLGVLYARKPALVFVNKNNTFVFANLIVISAVYYLISDIVDIDKSAVSMFVFYLVCLTVSYFLVRNFAHLNRQLEIYAERGAYNVSGTKKIYAYYFPAVLYMSIVPMIFCFVFVPYVVNSIGYITWHIAKFIGDLLTGLDWIAFTPVVADLNADPFAKLPDPENPPDSKEMLVYYIILFIFLFLIFIFRKQILKLIKEIIEYFKTKINLTGLNKNMIINQEIITEVKKDKKSKSSYRNYLKQVRKIKDLRQKFLFAYNYIFWNIIKKDEVLKESATPNEVAEKYEETQSLAELYQDLKYGNKSEENTEIETGIETAENYLKFILERV